MEGFAALVLFAAQQLGVVLALGAQTVLLVAHLSAVSRAEPSVRMQGEFVGAVRFAQRLGLTLMVLSGLLIVCMHVAAGAWAVLLAPAFVGKWLLIGAVMLAYQFEALGGLPRGAVEGYAGANWFALFLVHSMAPVISWGNLALLYVTWLVLFGILWWGALVLLRMGSTLNTHRVAYAGVAQTPAPAPTQALVRAPVPVKQKIATIPPTPKQKMPVPLPAIAAPEPLPAVVKAPAPAPAPKLQILPVPAPAPVPPPSPPPPAYSSAAALAPKAKQEPQKNLTPQDVYETELPAYWVMPKRAEDIVQGSVRL